MSQTEQNSYERYFEQINDEFRVMKDGLKQLIKDRTALGLENESILREFLKNYIPKHYSVGHGFIFRNQEEVSNQCDIIIYDSSFFPPLFKQGDFVIVLPESVMTVVEVKTEIRKGKSFLDSAVDNIKSVRKLNSRISGVIFAYRGGKPVTILNALTDYYKANKPDLKEIFELMVNLDGRYCIGLKRVDNEQVLFNFDPAVRNLNTETVLHTLATGKKNFYLFFYYIMRQIRTYVLNAFVKQTANKALFEEFSFVPGSPPEGIILEEYFYKHKDKINALHGPKKFDRNNEFLGISLGQRHSSKESSSFSVLV